VIPACLSYGLGLIPYSPLASGTLAGRERREGPGGRRDGNTGRNVQAKHGTKIEAFVGLCKELGEEPANVAIAWLLHQKAVTSPIIGPRTTEQLDATLRALEIKLESALLAKLDQIFPGPGKPAPEAYSW
jgi:NDP-hexose 2,3-enoyl reductase